MKGYPLSYFFGTSGGFQCFLVADDVGEVAELFGAEASPAFRHTSNMARALWSALALEGDGQRLAAVQYQADGRWLVQLAGPAALSLWQNSPPSGASGEASAQWLANEVRSHLLREASP